MVCINRRKSGEDRPEQDETERRRSRMACDRSGAATEEDIRQRSERLGEKK
jgi:hypothetical protein